MSSLNKNRMTESTRPAQPHPHGLSLLDDDEPAVTNAVEAKGTEQPDKDSTLMDSNAATTSNDIAEPQKKHDNPYDDILQQAAVWKSEMEATRDELGWLRVQNCRSLDGLTMVACTADFSS